MAKRKLVNTWRIFFFIEGSFSKTRKSHPQGGKWSKKENGQKRRKVKKGERSKKKKGSTHFFQSFFNRHSSFFFTFFFFQRKRAKKEKRQKKGRRPFLLDSSKNDLVFYFPFTAKTLRPLRRRLFKIFLPLFVFKRARKPETRTTLRLVPDNVVINWV